MSTKPQFEVVPDEPTPPGTNLLLLALRSLSQRAVIALADLFTLVTVLSAWVLWYGKPDPNGYQIVSLSIYALFILAVNVVIRRGLYASRK